MSSVLARNLRRIALGLLAVVFVLLFLNAFVFSGDDAGRSEAPAATTQTYDPANPVDVEQSQNGLLLAGFSLLGGWLAFGTAMFVKASRNRAVTKPA